MAQLLTGIEVELSSLSGMWSFGYTEGVEDEVARGLLALISVIMLALLVRTCVSGVRDTGEINVCTAAMAEAFSATTELRAVPLRKFRNAKELGGGKAAGECEATLRRSTYISLSIAVGVAVLVIDVSIITLSSRKPRDVTLSEIGLVEPQLNAEPVRNGSLGFEVPMKVLFKNRQNSVSDFGSVSLVCAHNFIPRRDKGEARDVVAGVRLGKGCSRLSFTMMNASQSTTVRCYWSASDDAGFYSIPWACSDRAGLLQIAQEALERDLISGTGSEVIDERQDNDSVTRLHKVQNEGYLVQHGVTELLAVLGEIILVSVKSDMVMALVQYNGDAVANGTDLTVLQVRVAPLELFQLLLLSFCLTFASALARFLLKDQDLLGLACVAAGEVLGEPCSVMPLWVQGRSVFLRARATTPGCAHFGVSIESTQEDLSERLVRGF